MLDINDMEILLEDVIFILERYIENNIKTMSHYDFEEKMIMDVYNLFKSQIPFIENEKDEQRLKYLINYALNKYIYVYCIPKRSYFNIKTAKLPLKFIEDMKKKVFELKHVKQPEQRTEEWYQYRKNRITASDAWKCIGTEASKNRFIVDKCTPIVMNPTDSNSGTKKYENTDTPFHHGKRFEPVSTLYYEFIHKTRVGEFGCIPHKKYNFIAASPDGIVDDETSDLFGRMVEIKNIVNREITGIPKVEYWIQMQLQMETCELADCDFLETRFKCYENEDAFNLDGTFQFTDEGKYKGIIMHFIGDDAPHYEYPPFNISKADFRVWEEEMLNKNKHMEWFENIYWYLDEISCVLVMRNKKWFESIIGEMGEIWNTILKERETGAYECRRPTKRTKKADFIAQNNTAVEKNKCLINISGL